MTEIYKEDDYYDIAKKIYDGFMVGQNCSVTGYVEDRDKDLMIEKGKLVLEHIDRWYKQEYLKSLGPKMCRKYTFVPDSIGGPLAHKIFKWKRVVLNDRPKYTIWRLQ